jgi:hypothetical protein
MRGNTIDWLNVNTSENVTRPPAQAIIQREAFKWPFRSVHHWNNPITAPVIAIGTAATRKIHIGTEIAFAVTTANGKKAIVRAWPITPPRTLKNAHRVLSR